MKNKEKKWTLYRSMRFKFLCFSYLAQISYYQLQTKQISTFLYVAHTCDAHIHCWCACER